MNELVSKDDGTAEVSQGAKTSHHFMNEHFIKAENSVEMLLPDYNGRKEDTDHDLLADCLNNIAEGFLAVSHSGNCGFLNRKAARMLMRGPSELTGCNIWETFPELVHAEFYTHFTQAIAEMEPIVYNGYLADPKSLLNIRIYPGGTGVSVFLKQVDPGKEFLENTGREGHLLRILMDNLPDYIYVKDATSRHIIHNKASVLFPGDPEQERSGKPILDYSGDPAFAARHAENDKLVIQSGKPQFDKEEVIITPAGEKRWLLTTKVPFRDEQNNVLGLVGISRDITERKNIENQLQELNDSLQEKAAEFAASNRELEQFAYVASHDLQEPLRMVSSFLQLLRKEYQHQLDKTAEQYIFFAVDGAERMKKLIMDLLEYSKLGSSFTDYELTSLDQVMDDVLGIFQETISQTGARIEKEALPDMRVNKLQVSQLFQNLLGNALKYSSESTPHIRISAKEQEQDWLFSIQDNGIGIESRFFERIFTIFQRLHSNSKYSGTGIGLALCKKIVEKHGGTIWVESEPGRGSVFYFTLSRNL